MDRFEVLREKAVPLLKPYVTRITVFGSYARGEHTATSDIDLLVTLRPANRRPQLGLKFFGLQEELSKTLGRPIDLATDDDLSPYIYKFIADEKVVIYEERRITRKILFRTLEADHRHAQSDCPCLF